MARPVSTRRIEKPPIMEGFRPFGIPLCDLKRAVLLFEEYEAVRLADHLGLGHEDAAGQMRVSRPTFTRIYEKARRTLALALVEGRVLWIEGGHYRTEGSWYRCEGCCRLLSSSKCKAGCPFCRSSGLRCLNCESCGEGGEHVCACHQPGASGAAAGGAARRGSECPSCGPGMAREHCGHHHIKQKKKAKK
jgi:uncharacterized protein